MSPVYCCVFLHVMGALEQSYGYLYLPAPQWHAARQTFKSLIVIV